jgi:hypothetical protein
MNWYSGLNDTDQAQKTRRQRKPRQVCLSLAAFIKRPQADSQIGASCNLAIR